MKLGSGGGGGSSKGEGIESNRIYCSPVGKTARAKKEGEGGAFEAVRKNKENLSHLFLNFGLFERRMQCFHTKNPRQVSPKTLTRTRKPFLGLYLLSPLLRHPEVPLGVWGWGGRARRFIPRGDQVGKSHKTRK